MGSVNISKAFLGLLLTVCLASCSTSLHTTLEQVRTKHNLPAIGGLIIENGAITSQDAIGTTRIDGAVKVGPESKWHLGSCTKAITAVVIATVVEEGKLSWDTKIKDVFPDFVATIRPEYHNVTLRMLLAHRGGLQHSISSKTSLFQLRQQKGTLIERRLRYAMEVLQDTPIVAPGNYSYSNVGYALAAAMAERVTKRSYEDLAFERLLRPLGVRSAGFGEQNYAGGESQPMPHVRDGERWVPIDSGTFADNPDVMNPGGRLHMTLEDWAKFALFVMGKYNGLKLIKPETRNMLLVPNTGWDYDWGWRIVEREWAGGQALMHSGSNNMNFATIWVLPKKQFALMLATNAGGTGEAIEGASKEILSKYFSIPTTP